MLIVRKLRLQRGWSQAELAQFSGLSVRTVQRIEKGDKPGLETLKAIASVFDMDVSDFHVEEEEMVDTSVSRDEERAFREVRKLRGFYSHLIMYLVGVGVMFAINLISDPDYIWAVWPALGWGVGIVSHGLRIWKKTIIFGPEWEKRQVEKRLGRDL